MGLVRSGGVVVMGSQLWTGSRRVKTGRFRLRRRIGQRTNEKTQRFQ
jgi:hypothetical protein